MAMLSYATASFGWRFSITVALLAALVLGLSLRSLAGAGPEVNLYGRADPSQFRAGELDPEAVRDATTFQEFPLVWVGEEFQGFELVEFLHKEGDGYDKVYLIYGDCESPAELTEPSCVPPLSIVINRPGSVPSPDAVEPRIAGPETERRGVTARLVSGGMVLWTGGVVITVHANSEHMDAAIDELKTVNHEILGESAIGPGDDLAPLAER